MINIILTLDYEIYGSGSGSVLNQMLYPTHSLLKICDKFEVPMNIMLEVTEYQKFKEFDKELSKDLGYSPSELIKSQISSAYNRGHDVQLHTHPQWMDAQYSDKKWIIKEPQRSIVDLSDKEAIDFLDNSKSELELLMRQVDLNYKCTAMRLTNLPWVEAPKKAIQAMISSNIKIHSFATSNSSKNNERGYWSLNPKNGIYEVPVFSVNMVKYKSYTFRRILAALKMFTMGRASVSHSYHINPSKTDLIGDFFKSEYPVKWDFSKQSSKEMIKFLEVALEKFNYNELEIPLVMVGHSKDFFYPEELSTFLSMVKNNKDYNDIVKFTTFTNFVKEI